MSLILNIDTASEKAHISFAKDGLVLATLSNASQKEHASFLQTAIGQLCKTTGILLPEIDAVAVTAGPGSYTGLRVGFASAKGLCYALKKPLISIGSLEMLTISAIDILQEQDDRLLYCPMIDARRMEVFTAVYKSNLGIFLAPCAMILDELSFKKDLIKNKIMFFGSGAVKWKTICNHTNALFENIEISPISLCRHSHSLFLKNIITELAYSEPFYVKEFQTVTKN